MPFTLSCAHAHTHTCMHACTHAHYRERIQVHHTFHYAKTASRFNSSNSSYSGWEESGEIEHALLLWINSTWTGLAEGWKSKAERRPCTSSSCMADALIGSSQRPVQTSTLAQEGRGNQTIAAMLGFWLCQPWNKQRTCVWFFVCFLVSQATPSP